MGTLAWNDLKLNYLPMFESWHVPFRDSYYKGEPDHAAATHHVFVYYMRMCYPDCRILGQGLSRRDWNLQPLGQCSDQKLQKGNSWSQPGIYRANLLPSLL